ncbi:MAG: hypothetical protein DIU82_03705 [Bacillota bacterium]|nr:hypothetical protein [Bacillota bacterium]REJ36626.1 MAG: hypothetical protein DIU82_03705 [Bacillota bacterium]
MAPAWQRWAAGELPLAWTGAVLAGLAVLLAVLYFWPLVLGLSIWLEPGTAAARLEATGLAGRLAIQLRLQPERLLVAELSLFHLATIRRSFADAMPARPVVPRRRLDLVAAAQWLLRRLRVEELKADARFGLGDAAQTARAYGYVWAAVAVGLAWAQARLAFAQPPRIELTPDFARPFAAARGVLRVRMAQGDALAAFVVAWSRGRAVERKGV